MPTSLGNDPANSGPGLSSTETADYAATLLPLGFLAASNYQPNVSSKNSEEYITLLCSKVMCRVNVILCEMFALFLTL